MTFCLAFEYVPHVADVIVQDGNAAYFRIADAAISVLYPNIANFLSIAKDIELFEKNVRAPFNCHVTESHGFKIYIEHIFCLHIV